MRVICTLLVLLGVAGFSLGKKSSSSSAGVVSSSSSSGYSQPIVPSYQAPVSHPHPGRHDYSYTGPMVAQASNQAEYYQPLDTGYAQPTYGTSGVAPMPIYARHAAPHPTGYYEPVPAAGGHHTHAHAHPIKRGWGWGSGGGGHGELGHLAILIPLIIIPLLLCWPWFVYAASHHHHPVVYAAPGWKRSSEGKLPVVKSDHVKTKVDELSEKILPKLSKE